ncbi:MAG: hypothetical protein WB696_31670, partial [Chthoniobacterales bacterium]
IFELGVEAGLIDSGGHFQLVKTGLSKAAPPKKRHRLLLEPVRYKISLVIADFREETDPPNAGRN